MKSRPKILRDLCSQKTKNFFSRSSSRVNLSQRRIINIPLIASLKAAVILVVFSYLVFGSALAPVGHNQLSLAAQTDEERQELEKQLESLETQMNEYQETVDKYRSRGKGLESEIARLNAKINKVSLQIKSITLSLRRLDGEINTNKSHILTTEEKIGQNKEILSRFIQNIYANENLSIAEILLRRPRLSDFFSDVSDLIDIQESMRGTLEEILELREELLDRKEALAIKRNDTEQLKIYQAAQKEAIRNIRKEKSKVLKATKGNEKKYQFLLKETQKTAAQIRSRIFSLLGGGEMSFEQAYAVARFAEQATGIRAALLLSVLDRESALGQNVGKCPYYDPERDKYYMHPKRDVPIFLALVSELKATGDAPPEPILVSCPISRDGAYGGAMGPAQFIPSTWDIYKDKIADITGSNPPSPWRNGDAFVATALYLKDSYNSRSCRSYADRNSHISPKQKLQERCAAAKYYAGGRWYTYRWVYGEPVLERADRFQKDIDILNS